MNTRRAGFTLIELLVTIALIGIISGVAALAFRVPVRTLGNDDIAKALGARRQALREGRPITIEVVGPGGARSITAYSNGTIVADPQVGLDRIDIVEPKRRQ